MKYFTLLSFAIFGTSSGLDASNYELVKQNGLYDCDQVCGDDYPTEIEDLQACGELFDHPGLTIRGGDGTFYERMSGRPATLGWDVPIEGCYFTLNGVHGFNLPDDTPDASGYETESLHCVCRKAAAKCADTPADFCAGTKKDVTCSGAVCTKSECCEPVEQAFPIFYAYCSINLNTPTAQMSSTVNLQIVEYDESVNFGGCASKGYKALGDPSQQVTWDDPTTGASWTGVTPFSNKNKNQITADHCSTANTGKFFYESSQSSSWGSISGNQISYNGKNYQICVPCYTNVQGTGPGYYDYPHLRLNYECSTLDASFSCLNTDGVSRCQVPPPTKCEDDNTFQCQNGVVSGDLSNGDDPHANCACTCDSGWEGASCDTACSSGWTGSGCTEAIQCTQGSKGPCQNGGTATGLEHDNSCACDCPVGFGGYECEHDISNLNVKTDTIRANGLYNKVEKRAQLKDLGKKVLESKLAAGISMKQAIKESRVDMVVDDYGDKMKVFLTRLTDGGKALKMAVGPENAGVQDACEAKAATGATATAADCGMFDLADDSTDSTTTLISTASEGSYTIVVDGDEIISKQTQVTNGYKMECWDGSAWGSTTFFTGLDEDTDVRDRLYTCKGRVLIVGSQGGFCTSESCSGHGECVQVEDSYTCNCHQDYAGGTCEVECLTTDKVTYQNVCGCTC